MALPTNCQNPECNKIFPRNNSKKIYCSSYCKNRTNYMKYLSENADEIEWQKNYKKNIKILDDIYSNGVRKVYKTTLDQIGFDKKFLKIQNLATNNSLFYELGNYKLIKYSDTEYKIEKKA